MKLFECQSCGNILYFENRFCGRCGHRVGFMPEREAMTALEPVGDKWLPLGATEQPRMFCANAFYDACNWLVGIDTGDVYCVACRHNGVVPDLSDATRLHGWRELEFAKHRLFYSLMRWKLPLRNPH